MNEAGQSRRFRVGLLGTGRIAEIHLEVLRRLSAAEVVAVHDRDGARAEAFARRAGGLSVCATPERLFARCDTVHVLTPPPSHEELAEAALAAGRHVFAEKPLALTRQGVERLRTLAADRGLALEVNHCLRHHPAVREARQILEQGRIGRLEHVALVWFVPLRQYAAGQWGAWLFRAPHHLPLECAPHPLSLLADLWPDDPAIEVAAGDPETIPGGGRIWKCWRFRFAGGGLTADLHLALARPRLEQRVLLAGSDGSVALDLGTGAILVREPTRWPEFWEIRTWLRRDAANLRRRARRAVRDFARGVLGLGPPGDLFRRSMLGSIESFYARLSGHDDPPRAASALFVAAALDRARRAVPEAAPAPRRRALPRPSDGDVLVTGAGGFIGRHTVAALVARGLRVRALVRPGTPPPPETAPVAGHLGDLESLGRAVRGARAVVHLATGLGSDWQETERLAVRGTRALAEAALEAGVERFVHVSSIAALDLSGRRPVGDDAAPDPRPRARSDYARAKILAEHGLAELAERGLPLVVVRPGLVVGPGGRTRHSGVGYWINDAVCLGWDGGETPLPFVLARDVACALVEAVLRPAAAGRRFLLAGPVRPDARTWVAELARRSGRPIRFVPQSPLAIHAADILKWIVKRAARRQAPFPSWRDLRTRALRAPLVAEAASAVLDWRPETDAQAFFAEAIDRALARGQRP